MNWLNAFELMCYIIVTVMLADLIRKKDYNSIFIFGAAAIAGFAMELLAVNVSDIYYYSDSFWLSLGKAPKQFPVFGGIMWGGLTVYGIKLAKKLCFGKWLTALCAGMFIVSMDILLDVVAIRLDGGFWTWVGHPIQYEITGSAFLGVIWVNFFGYMIETPAVALLTLIKCEKVEETDWKHQILYMFLIALASIIITGAGSLAALFLNSITNDWFACITFILTWLIMVILIIIKALKCRLSIGGIKSWNMPMILFWLAMYGYCLAAVAYLEIPKILPWFMVLGILFAAGTLFVSLAEPNSPDVDRVNGLEAENA